MKINNFFSQYGGTKFTDLVTVDYYNKHKLEDGSLPGRYFVYPLAFMLDDRRVKSVFNEEIIPEQFIDEYQPLIDDLRDEFEIKNLITKKENGSIVYYVDIDYYDITNHIKKYKLRIPKDMNEVKEMLHFEPELESFDDYSNEEFQNLMDEKGIKLDYIIQKISDEEEIFSPEHFKKSKLKKEEGMLFKV